MKRKLQVFISSTYKDLQPERAAAVRAILDAGHMPSGMEAFAAGNASVWETIRGWIDSCDALMVIIGGRYGEVEPESGKSYTQLEYEYAQQRGKEVFALVLSKDALDAKARTLGADAHDDYGEKLKAFRELVLKKMGAMVSDPQRIQYETMKALSEIADRGRVSGWVPGNVLRRLEDENTVLASENASLREAVRGNGADIPFAALLTLLEADHLPAQEDTLAKVLVDNCDAVMQVIWSNQRAENQWLYDHLGPRLHLYGVVDFEDGEHGAPSYRLNERGRVVIICLKAKRAGVNLPQLPEEHWSATE
jgi:hypothetical protein